MILPPLIRKQWSNPLVAVPLSIGLILLASYLYWSPFTVAQNTPQVPANLKIKSDIPVSKANLTIIGGKTIHFVEKEDLPITIKAQEGGVFYSWHIPEKVKALRRGNVLLVQDMPKGQNFFSVDIGVVDVDFKNQKVISRQEVGEVCVYYESGPSPGPEPDPGPEPEPDPKPEPDDPAPIPEEGLRVLIIEESDERAKGKMPKSQVQALSSERLWNFLNSNCVSDVDGTKAWGIFDDDNEDIKNYGDPLNNAYLKYKSQVTNRAILIVSIGKTGYVGPLPGDLDSIMAIIEKFKK